MALGFSEKQWQRIREDYTAWWRGELNRPLICLTRGDRTKVKPLSGFLTNWPQDLSDDEIVAAATTRVARERCCGDALPHFFVNYGPGIAAAFMGASVHAAEDTTWFGPARHSSIADLHIALDRENVWWKRISHVTALLAERIGARVQVSFTDLGGNLDILAALRGTDKLLMDCAEFPEEVERCSGEITRTWLEVYDELDALISPHCPGSMAWAPTWAPERTYILQSDFSYMISPGMFKRFVMPDLRACCDRLKRSFYHLDGKGQIAHLDQLLSIENLHGIQWIPGAGQPEASEWPDVLGKIREAGRLCQVGASPHGALKIIQRHGGRGFLLLIHADNMTEADAKRFLNDAKSLYRGS